MEDKDPSQHIFVLTGIQISDVTILAVLATHESVYSTTTEKLCL